MGLLNKLELAIKELEGFEGSWSEKYATYMKREDFDKFRSSLSTSAVQRYEKELCEKCGAPPKMASFGSSSRLISRLSSDIDGFVFGKRLSTGIGEGTLIDGFLDDDCRYIFVSSECREPYRVPYDEKPVKVSKRYKELYEYLAENSFTAFGFTVTGETESDMTVYFDCYGEPIKYFDLKKMISHMLGMGTALLKGQYRDKPLDYMYLLYNPTDLVTDEATKEELSAIYDRLCYECNTLELSELFILIVTYLRDVKRIGTMTDDGIGELIYRFTLYVCDQEFYPRLMGQ
jgi:hypothetical protein